MCESRPVVASPAFALFPVSRSGGQTSFSAAVVCCGVVRFRDDVRQAGILTVSQAHPAWTMSSKVDNINLDLSDDEELREQMDLHSIIVSCVNEEPPVHRRAGALVLPPTRTPEVIEEIEEMMQESPDPEAEESPSQSDLSMLSFTSCTRSPHSTSTSSYEERLRGLGMCELEELLEEVEREIRRYSEELIEQLALRDERGPSRKEGEKRLHLYPHRRAEQTEGAQRDDEEEEEGEEHRGDAEERAHTPAWNSLQYGRFFHCNSEQPPSDIRGLRRGQDRLPPLLLNHHPISPFFYSSLHFSFLSQQCLLRFCMKYLTTVIPYDKKNGAPSVEDLQILTKILHAMRDDSEKVPSLLTDYILKVLCPT
ncbi:hypothetical protein SRHO_G00076160 [Serrasalmus rhombeus]